MRKAQTVRQPSSNSREPSDSDLPRYKDKPSSEIQKELEQLEKKLSELEASKTQLLQTLQEKGQTPKLQGERISVIYDWEATDSNQLSVLTGEEVILLQSPPSSEWIAVCKIGWIPKVCLPSSALSSTREPPPPVNRDIPPPVSRDIPPPVSRDIPPPVSRDIPPPVSRDAPPPVSREPSMTVSRPIPSPGREVPSRKPATVRNPSSSSLTSAEGPEPIPAGGAIAYQDLVDKKVPSGTDLARLEIYLSDEEFKVVFKMDKAAFYKQPAWKIATAKKRAMLF